MRPRVGVIDSSASIRETVAIVLHDYAVEGLLPDSFASSSSPQRSFDLMIIEDGLLPSSHLQDLPHAMPVLWLRDPHLPGWHSDQQGSLPRPFSPTALRAEVKRLLERRGTATASPASEDFLAPPTLPIDAARLALVAAQTVLPVLLCGEAGTGKLRVARAIHARSGGGAFSAVAAADCDRRLLSRLGEMAPHRTTLFVNDVDQIGGNGQQLLLELIEAGGVWLDSTWHPVRTLCATSLSLDQLSESTTFDPELLYRLAVFPIRLPALRDRTAELPGIIDAVARQLSARLRIVPPQFTTAAVERLTRYLWFGNLAELETVLARTLLLTTRRPLDADDLLFGYARGAPQVAETSGQPNGEVSDNSPTSDVPPAVDVLINELAHEFKNPMVTIKTISHHLERLLADESGRQHVAQLAGEAIDRMDRTLENLLQFTRFRTPTPHSVSLNGLLAPCLTELAPLLTERRIVLNYQPPEAIATYIDGEQIVYALGNLLRTIVRDLEEGAALTIRCVEPAPTLCIEFPSPSAAVVERLSRYADAPPSASAAPLALGFLFARALVERNGGQMEMAVHNGVKQVTIRLPRHEGIELAHGKT